MTTDRLLLTDALDAVERARSVVAATADLHRRVAAAVRHSKALRLRVAQERLAREAGVHWP